LIALFKSPAPAVAIPSGLPLGLIESNRLDPLLPPLLDPPELEADLLRLERSVALDASGLAATPAGAAMPAALAPAGAADVLSIRLWKAGCPGTALELNPDTGVVPLSNTPLLIGWPSNEFGSTMKLLLSKP
jgi:hypothetical protein